MINKYVEIKNTNMGDNVTIIEPSNIYGCKIGENTFVGPFVEIQEGVIIGRNCKVQSHAFICEKVTIGNDCFISHGAMFVNDTFSDGKPAGGNKKLWRETTIGNNVLIGTNATILPVSICSNVVIGAGSVITKDIVEPGVYIGNPGKKLK